MIITSTAPTRIDLAGGTIDIWPLYTLFKESFTINAAIDLYAKVTLKDRTDKKIIIISKDRDERIEFDSIKTLHHDHNLPLISHIIDHYRPQKGFTLTTECQAPAYAGLGGSSSLNIAVNGAMNRFCDTLYTKRTLLHVAQNIEARVIRSPTGIQDYIAALEGGVNIIALRDQGPRIIKANDMIKRLNEHMLIINSGKPHNSGLNNWQIIKNVLEAKGNATSSLKEIAITSENMAQALRKKDIPEIAALTDTEWDNRKKLSRSVSSRIVEEIISKVKKNNGSAKVCGAGGGGCILCFAQRKYHKAIQRIGNCIPAKIVKKGLHVDVKKR